GEGGCVGGSGPAGLRDTVGGGGGHQGGGVTVPDLPSVRPGHKAAGLDPPRAMQAVPPRSAFGSPSIVPPATQASLQSVAAVAACTSSADALSMAMKPSTESAFWVSVPAL